MREKKKQLTNIKDFEVLYDYILVKAIDPTSVEGLERPDQYEDKPEFGEVIKCGEGRLMENGTIVPLKFKPGDVIYFGKYSALSVRSEGEDYILVRDDDVMAFLNK